MYQEEPREQFDLTQKDFTLCSFDMKPKDTSYILAVNIIDSYSKSIKITQIIDCNFFTSFESLLKQIIPPHEDTNFYILANCPDSQSFEKVKNITTSMGVFTKSVIKLEDQNFKEKISDDIFYNIKLLFPDENINNYQTLYSGIDTLFPLELLNHTTNYINILSSEVFHHFFTLTTFNNKEFMNFDLSCIKCLNLFDSMEESKNFLSINSITKLAKTSNLYSKKTSIFSILNNCCTKFGARMLRNWLLQPLQDINKINERLDIVEGLNSRFNFNVELRNSFLSKIDDIQTINMKLSRYKTQLDKGIDETKKIKLEDLAKLQRSIASCKDLYAFIKVFDGDNKDFFEEKFTKNLSTYLGFLGKLEELIFKTVYYDDTNREYIINPAVNDKLNDLKNLIDKNYEKIVEIKDEVEEEINNISNKPKKVKIEEYVNSGYILEITKKEGDEFLQQNRKKYKLVSSNKRSVMINSRDLIALSEDIKEERNKFKKLQTDWVRKIIDVVCTYLPVLENVTTLLATLDILSSFSILIFNSKNNFCRPKIGQPKTKLFIENCRHLLLEYLNQNPSPNTTHDEIEVISNDISLTPGLDNFHLLTGINMGGKSTYLRQIGICVILAHIGCFIPATKAEIPIIDQIFTRVGAGDMMLKGVSTYMNEMIEVCSLIKSATENSLLLIDELGRGTSTKDGVAISAGIIEYICEDLKSYCLFATHFYELTKLEEQFSNLKNYYVGYKIKNGKIKMTYKVLPGKINTSLGIDLFKALNFDKETCDLLDKFQKEQEEKDKNRLIN
jgi:DNA mismatch repair protein MSH2